MSTTTQSLLHQAKGFLTAQIEDLKLSLAGGYNLNDHPQAKLQHDSAYLNDIARGNWRLKRGTTTSVKYRPVVNFPADYKMDNFKLRRFDKNPLLEDIKKGRRLHHVNTNDKSRMLIEKGWRARKAIDHKKFMSEITGFSRSTLRPVQAIRNPPTNQIYMNKAKGFLADKLEDLKTALGFYDYPQKNVFHQKRYMNDIARGNWKLRRWTSTSVKYRPVVNVPSDYMMDCVKVRKFDRNPLLEQIRKGKRLHHVTTNDKSRLYVERTWRARKALDRQKFISEITAFPVTKLRHVDVDRIRATAQSIIQQTRDFLADKLEDVKFSFGYYGYPQKDTKHDRDYLNDIAKGNWKLRRWTSTSIRHRPTVGVPSGYKMRMGSLRKLDRAPFLAEIKTSHRLRPVITNDKTRLYVEKGWKSKRCLGNKMLNAEITGFSRKLKHAETVDRSVPQINKGGLSVKIENAGKGKTDVDTVFVEVRQMQVGSS